MTKGSKERNAVEVRESPLRPRITELPSQTMAVVHARGEPRKAADEALPALYGSVYLIRAQLKRRGKAFKVGPLRARWPDAHLVPRDRWTALFALPIPDSVVELPQKKTDLAVVREVWVYGTVAELLHIGSYDTEGPTVRQLHAFIADSGYEICGSHEEVYLTTRRARTQKTLIRYPVRPKSRET
jgi:hypothetical protein